MEKEIYYKYMFILVAIYIFVNILIFFLASIFMTDTIFTLFGATSPPSLIWLHISLFLIFTFGIGYIIVSRDISKNHSVVMIGAMVRTEFFIISLDYFMIEK